MLDDPFQGVADSRARKMRQKMDIALQEPKQGRPELTLLEGVGHLAVKGDMHVGVEGRAGLQELHDGLEPCLAGKKIFIDFFQQLQSNSRKE